MLNKLHRIRFFLIAGLATALTAADGPRFPKPDPAAALGEYKTYAAPGDPLRRVVEDWDGARRRAAEPRWRDWVAARRAEVDEWKAHRRDKVEWRSGWHHDFVSPKDGSFLVWTPDEPGPDTLRSRNDPKTPVALTPTLHDAWVYRFRTQNASLMPEAARLFRLTGERAYADWAAGQLDFYAANYKKFPRLPKPQPGTQMMYQSLDEATMLSRFVETARLLDDFATPERKRAWLEGLFRPQCELLAQTRRDIHNIACWQRSAAAQVALLYHDDALWKQAVDGPFGVRQQVREGITGDYLWYEQSLGYNSYTARALMPMFEAAWLAGRAGELRDEMLAVQNLILSPMALRFPDGRLPTPADQNGTGKAPDRETLADAARLFPNPIGLKEASKRRTWATLVDPLPAPSGSYELPPVVSRDLESSRMAVLSADGWQVFFHYGQLTQSHAQAEALNFEATFKDVDVTHDPGTVGYGSPLHRGWYRTAPAHNVPMIDGQGQVGWDPGERGSFSKTSSTAAQPRYSPDASASRRLSIEGGKLVDEATVEALHVKPGAKPHAGLALHVQGHVEAPESLRADASFAGSRPAPFQQWKDARTATYRDRAEFIMTTAKGARFRLTFQTPGAFRVTLANTPDAPPKRRDSFYLETDAPKATFRTTFEPLEGEKPKP
ncbi:heparinase II/III domain-containing protein [Paludisphaera rhizosphaerae]|uniref:heparinase II/III domain-containing protein n=1 Tax=Paludisphaera rhizosphaerae TaxID=2711216 RepID=UPI0013ED0875|nr:heparinase II/III family protein [Paludisphaera rhizosphaerae]